MNRHAPHCVGLVIGWLAFAAAAFGQTGADETKDEIAKLFGTWNEALRTGKADEVVKLYAPDAVLVPTMSNKIRHSRAEIKEYFRHFEEYQPTAKINEQNIQTFGTVAVNSGIYTFALTKDGKRSEVRARFTFVYHRRGDQWLIVTHHSSLMPE